MYRRANLPVSKPSGPVLGLAAVLVAGLFAGLVIGAIWSRIGQEGVPEDAYVVMVSLLYDRERSVPNALDRLALLENGNSAHSITVLADAYPKAHPEAQTESRAIRQLASALNKDSASSQPTRTPSGETKSGGGFDGMWLWLGIALLFVSSLGVGGPMVLRLVDPTRRRLSPSFGRKSRYTLSLESRPQRRPTASPPSIRTLNYARQEMARESADDDAPEQVSVLSSPRAEFRFQSHYQFGEDPYDEVHPIVDRASGSLIGACGFSSELKMSEENPGRFYAFSVWAHDYVGGDKFKRIGIVSKWAKSKAPPDLVRWAGNGKMNEVVVANPGMRIVLDTGNLHVDVNISSFRYGTESGLPQDGYFASLATAFDVRIKSSEQG